MAMECNAIIMLLRRIGISYVDGKKRERECKGGRNGNGYRKFYRYTHLIIITRE